MAAIRLSIMSDGAITCAPACAYADDRDDRCLFDDELQSVWSTDIETPQWPVSVNAQRHTSTHINREGNASRVCWIARIAGLWVGSPSLSKDLLFGTGNIMIDCNPLSTSGFKCAFRSSREYREIPGRVGICEVGSNVTNTG